MIGSATAFGTGVLIVFVVILASLALLWGFGMVLEYITVDTAEVLVSSPERHYWLSDDSWNTFPEPDSLRR